MCAVRCALCAVRCALWDGPLHSPARARASTTSCTTFAAQIIPRLLHLSPLSAHLFSRPLSLSPQPCLLASTDSHDPFLPRPLPPHPQPHCYPRWASLRAATAQDCIKACLANPECEQFVAYTKEKLGTCVLCRDLAEVGRSIHACKHATTCNHLAEVGRSMQACKHLSMQPYAIIWPRWVASRCLPSALPPRISTLSPDHHPIYTPRPTTYRIPQIPPSLLSPWSYLGHAFLPSYLLRSLPNLNHR